MPDAALAAFLELKGLEELIRLGRHTDRRILESALMSLVVLADDGTPLAYAVRTSAG